MHLHKFGYFVGLKLQSKFVLFIDDVDIGQIVPDNVDEHPLQLPSIVITYLHVLGDRVINLWDLKQLLRGGFGFDCFR